MTTERRGERSEDESTQEIDIDALRDSLAKARGGGKTPGPDPDAGIGHEDPTVMAHVKPPPQARPRPPRHRRDSEATFLTPNPNLPDADRDLPPPEPLEPEGFESAPRGVEATPSDPRLPGAPSSEQLVDLADIEDADDEDDDPALAVAASFPFKSEFAANDADETASPPGEPSPSFFGTMPGHDVAQALRAMMGEPEAVPHDHRTQPLAPLPSYEGDDARPWSPDVPPLRLEDTQTRHPEPATVRASERPVRSEGAHLGENFRPTPEVSPRLALDSFEPRAASGRHPHAPDAQDALPAFALEELDLADSEQDARDRLVESERGVWPKREPAMWAEKEFAWGTGGAPSDIAPVTDTADAIAEPPPLEGERPTARGFGGEPIAGAIARSSRPPPFGPVDAPPSTEAAEGRRAWRGEPPVATSASSSHGVPTVRRGVDFGSESTGITRAVELPPDGPPRSNENAETTAVFRGPLPALARKGSGIATTREPATEEVQTSPPPPAPSSFLMVDSGELEVIDDDAIEEIEEIVEATRSESRREAEQTRPPFPTPNVLEDSAEPERELPRFTLASIPEMGDAADMPEPIPASDIDPTRSARPTQEDVPILDRPPSADRSAPAAGRAPNLAGTNPSDPELRASAFSVDLSDFDAPRPASVVDREEQTATGAPIAEPPAGDIPEGTSESNIAEFLPEELLDNGALAADPTIGVAGPRATSSLPPARHRPTTFRPPAPQAEIVPAFMENPDDEMRELIAEQRFGPMLAVYRQRLGLTDGPNKQAAILLKMASVYEFGLQDPNEAFQTLIDAFEVAPGNEDVVAAIDRVGKLTGRIQELADRVKKKLLPGATDDKKVIYLGHLVFWYERVLGRGSEVSSFVSEIERQDRVHPVVLRRAAQIAAMNDDAKTQREHLLRALERTTRREEKAQIYIALAGAYGGTPDALKWYQATLEIDPTSLVALQGVKRIGKEKENYPQMQWALEQQAEVAPTDAERVDALLELADLQETKFLKRPEAAALLERVLALDPAQPTAMKGLERCYHALRDWPALSRILSIRSEHTFDAKQKVQLLERAAEVHESKLGDPSGAIEVYRNILVVDPKHRRSLGDLARLYEKMGDWSNVATYKARLAELASSKRISSQELIKLGDFLNTPERDPIAARLQYERAVVVDPTNAAGWEAVQKIATATGDERRVIECLEQRRKYTDVPRQRAAVLVELANSHLRSGAEDDARKCFEDAIKADSSNEQAAIAMLDAYTAEEEWALAAPLCELLVNAAIRDRDSEALFVRLRLATRIAAALGDADRAVTSAIAAFEARPEDPGAQADLIAVCSQSPTALERAREQIAKVAQTAQDLSSEMLIRLAGLQRDSGDLDGAADTYQRAREMEPEDREITKELANVFLLQGDFPRACKLKVDLARNATSAEERFELFVEAGEIWGRRADELEKAASVFEEARAIKPTDPWLLQTLVWLYGELGDFATQATALEDLIEVQTDPHERLKTISLLADVFRDRLGDLLRAADLYDQVLDLDRKRLDVFEELVRALTEAKNWERLERSYRKMIARVKDENEPQLQFLLFHQLGLIYRDRLGDASRAYDSLDAASRLRPDDAEVRKIVIELLVVTDNLDNAVSRIRDEIDRNPHDPELFAELYELFLRQHFFDKAWCAVNILCRLREPTPEQRRFHEDYAPMPLDRVPGQIVEQAWRSHIFHADLDPALTSLFALMTPAVARMRFGQLRPEQRVGRPFTPNHSRLHDKIRAGFANASEILAIAPPELLLGDPKAPSAFAPALAPFGSIQVSVPQVEAQASSLVFLVGKRLAEQRPELTARAFFPAVPDLTSLLGTAIRVSRNEGAKDAAAAALDASFAAILTREERDGIRSIILQATSEGAALDVKTWSHAADLSSMRAGLLLAGDVEEARQAIGTDTTSLSDMSAQDKVGELFRFAVSDLYADLRGAIGVSVQA